MRYLVNWQLAQFNGGDCTLLAGGQFPMDVDESNSPDGSSVLDLAHDGVWGELEELHMNEKSIIATCLYLAVEKGSVLGRPLARSAMDWSGALVSDFWLDEWALPQRAGTRS